MLITGAAGAMGSALARAFRARHADASLTLADIDLAGAEATARAAGGEAHAVRWDLTQPAAIPALLEDAVARRGPVDVLVNCAGVMEVRTLAGTSWETGARLLDIDLVSPLRLMSLVTPAMMARRSGAIINVSSMAGVVPLRGCTFYGAAKAGLAMASEIARLELAPHGVAVLTVYPGPVRSALERRARAQLPPALIARALPTGDAEALANRIVRALAEGAPRVVYPPLYDVAQRAPRIAGWVTSLLSPIPND
ncbi:oxidoreductase, short-chain dehydrogenase/reductase family protein [Minicystis rosea]|nr:oxidoreductase, short-chain dehydrogenase/reductase family protein [Minicystis rosea]